MTIDALMRELAAKDALLRETDARCFALVKERDALQSVSAQTRHELSRAELQLEWYEQNLAVARHLLQGAYQTAKVRIGCECETCQRVREFFDGTAGRAFLEEKRGLEIACRGALAFLERLYQPGAAVTFSAQELNDVMQVLVHMIEGRDFPGSVGHQ